MVDGQIAVITNVGRDHTDGAPGWWRRIAEEKAGIVKPGASVVIGETVPELAEIVAALSPAVVHTLATTSGYAPARIQLRRLPGDRRPRLRLRPARIQLRRLPATTDRGSGYARREYSSLLSNEVAVGGRLLSLQTPRASHTEVFLGLHGAHQATMPRSRSRR